jgi:hypothetical protein
MQLYAKNSPVMNLHHNEAAEHDVNPTPAPVVDPNATPVPTPTPAPVNPNATPVDPAQPVAAPAMVLLGRRHNNQDNN